MPNSKGRGGQMQILCRGGGQPHIKGWGKKILREGDCKRGQEHPPEINPACVGKYITAPEEVGSVVIMSCDNPNGGVAHNSKILQ